MKKFGLRIALFIFSLAFGVGIVWLVNLLRINKIECPAETIREKTVESKTTPEIEIKFKRYIDSNVGASADFNVTNNGAQTLYYDVYKLREGQKDEIASSELMLDGRKIDQSKSGVELKTRSLRPGETKIFRFDDGLLSLFWKDETRYQAGFYFRKEAGREPTLYWSEKMPITFPMRTALLKSRSISD